VDRTVRTVAGPPVPYYLAIDGTEAQDAATFGALLEGRGWKNLAATYLKPAPDDPTRLIDPAHEYLPIPLVAARGRKIAVVAPGGRDGRGLDPFWLKLGRWKEDGVVIDGRLLAAELSAAFMRELILCPAIHTHPLESETLSRHFADEKLPYASRHAPAASILYVSSHGYQSGVMIGDPLRHPENPSLKGPYPRPYLGVAQVAQHGRGFHGPEWIVLAQCSTMNPGVWSLWARILANSSPGVRGIVAYEEASPKAEPAIRVAERFFGYLDQGASFLDAWAHANRTVRWSALVHKEARGDTLTGINRWSRLSDVTTSSTKASYYGYTPSLGTSGEPVLDTLPPFWLKLEHQSDRNSPFVEVAAERYAEATARFSVDETYRWTLHGNDLGPMREASVTVVYLRDSLKEGQLSWNKLFRELAPAGGVTADGFDTTTLILRPDPTRELSSLTWLCRANRGDQAGMESSHSFLWFRVAVRTDEGILRHDFKTLGLYY
jgi:hypothetical protein